MPLAAMLMLACGTAHANLAEGQEAGRLKVCLKSGATTASAGTTLEIPYDGKFVLSAKGGAAPVFVEQTNFAGSAGQAGNRNPDGYDVKVENRNGAAIAAIEMAGRHCVYLDAVAPVSQDKNMTWSASFVHPEWQDAEAKKADKFSYRYFTSVDSTFYVASDVGKNLQYVVHEMNTGGYTNRDKFNNVATDNAIIKSMVSNAFQHALENINQYDVEAVDTALLGSQLVAADLKDDVAVAKAVAQFRKNVAPPPKSRLIVALPFRLPVKVPYRSTTIYGGKVEGLGFYVDLGVWTESADGTALGSFDVFMNCRVAVIDVDTAKVLAVRDYSNGKVFSAIRSPNGSPFAALTDGEMFMTLNYIAAEGAGKVVGEVFERR